MQREAGTDCTYTVCWRTPRTDGEAGSEAHLFRVRLGKQTGRRYLSHLTLSSFSHQNTFFVKLKNSKWIIKMQSVLTLSEAARGRPACINLVPLCAITSIPCLFLWSILGGIFFKSPFKLKLGVNSHPFCSFLIKEQDGVGRLPG